MIRLLNVSLGPKPFIFSVTVLAGQSFQLPTMINGTYACTINWGDSSSNTLTVWNSADRVHNYVGAGVYDISISGVFVGWDVNRYFDRLKITEIKQWGALRLINADGHFRACANMSISATDIINLSQMNSFNRSFEGCVSITTIPNINSWDVSGIISLVGIFNECSGFNQSLSNWDVSNVFDFASAFLDASTFNQNIGNWNTSSATNMYNMFNSATAFNQSLSSWDVSNVTNFSYMFRDANSFNQDLSIWDVSAGTNFYNMFAYANSFNQDLSIWDVSAGTNFRSMFQNASLFNQDLSGWDVSNVTEAIGFCLGTSFSKTNYDALLIGWSSQSLISGGRLGVSANYSAAPSAAATARGVLTSSPNNWTVSDLGPI